MGVIKACIISCVLFTCLKKIEGNVIVETSSGKVAGIEVTSILPDEKYFSFLGIPYAQPPLKELRFMPPKPHPGWSDILEAKTEKTQCPQFLMPPRRFKEYGFNGKEDCLYLSIHTPNLPSEKVSNQPVIVFFYNEQYQFTFNASKEYGPDFFMKENAVFVTINHRIGAMGFLSYGDDLLPGNNGLRDIILALKWLQVNIHKFGGDPHKVTLMGSIGGAAAVDLLLHVPKAKGLFSHVILQSGTSWNSMYLGSNPQHRAKELANYLDIQSTSSSLLLKELSRLSTEDIVNAEFRSIHADESRHIQIPIIPFGPVIEHEHAEALITEYPDNSTFDIDIPIMIGYNSREAIQFIERLLRKPQYLTFADSDFLLNFPIRVNYRFNLHSNTIKQAIEEIKDYYFEEGYIKISKPGEYMTYITDALNFYSIDYTVRKYVNETKSQIFYYTFDYSGEFNLRKLQILEEAVTMEGTWGATTGDELCYLFVCKPIIEKYQNAIADPESEEMTVLRRMVRLWTNFAKSGNPTPQGEEFTWTPATKENKECLVISDELQMKSNVHGERIKFWDDFITKYREMAVNGVVKDVKDEL